MNMRGWRNRQTRTFEGRVVIPCEFKSRSSHQIKNRVIELEDSLMTRFFVAFTDNARNARITIFGTQAAQ